jgi:hypothetical protein
VRSAPYWISSVGSSDFTVGGGERGRAAGDRGGGGAQERCGRHDTVTEASPIDDLLPVVVAAAL